MGVRDLKDNRGKSKWKKIISIKFGEQNVKIVVLQFWSMAAECSV